METSWNNSSQKKRRKGGKMEIKVPEITKKNIKIAKLNPSTLVIILIVTGTFHPMTHHIRAV